MDETQKKLEEEIVAQLERIAAMEDGTEEKRRATEHLEHLYKLRMEEKRFEAERLDHVEETQAKQKESKRSIIFKVIEVGSTVLGVVAPLGFYGVWMNRGLEYEKTGAFTSSTFKGLISRFRPTK